MIKCILPLLYSQKEGGFTAVPFSVCCKIITQPFIKSSSDLINEKLFTDFVNDGLHTYWTIIFHVPSVIFFFMNKHRFTSLPILWPMAGLDTAVIKIT